MSETRSIILTIIAPTIILLAAQIVPDDPSMRLDIFGAVRTAESFSILVFSAWSLIFSVSGWVFFVDKKTFGLKKAATKKAFAAYMLFLASIILSALFLNTILKGVF